MAITAVPSSHPAPFPARLRSCGKYIIRTDMHYSPSAKMITIILELPGIKKSDVSLKLSICNGVKQLEVAGTGRPTEINLYEDSDRDSVERDTRGAGDERGEKTEKNEDKGYFMLMERK